MTEEENIFAFTPLTTNVIETPEEDHPPQSDPAWPDYVMSKFLPAELIEINGSKYPNCYGLRRVTTLVLGEILFSGVKQAHYTNTNPPRTVITYSVIISQHSGGIKEVCDIAGVSSLNTDDFFLGYPDETAATRAEGRCLRKLLMLNCVAAEELTRNKDVANAVRGVEASKPTDGSYNSSGKMSENQFRLLSNKCNELGIDPLKFVRTKQEYNDPKEGLLIIGGSADYKEVTEVSKKETINLIKLLGNYQNNSQSIPKEVLV